MNRIEFETIGGDWVDPPMLMPASLPLELSGEAVRSRLLTSADAPGEELALRPDLTLAVVQHHLDQGAPGPASYRYFGKAFRQPVSSEEPLEFYQTGFECLGHEDRIDQDVIALSALCHAVADAGVDGVQLYLGDISLFAAVVDALKLSPFWSDQLIRAFRRKEGIRTLLTNGTAPPRSALASTLAEVPQERASALLEEVLAFSGGQVIGGRTKEDILARLKRQAEAGREGPLDPRAKRVLSDLIQIEGTPEQLLKQLRTLAQANDLDLQDRLARSDAFFTMLTEQDVPFWKQAHVSVQFGRRFDYYDGLVFELAHTGLGTKRPLAAGGRYDGLLSRLSGSAKSQPAVGGVVRPDRLEAALQLQGAGA